MKIKNQDIVTIYKTLLEISDSKEAKQALPDSGKIIYAVTKNINTLKPVFIGLRDKEMGFREAHKEAYTKENEKELNAALTKDLNNLFQVEEQEITLHKMNMDSFEILQKYLTGDSTVALATYLVQE